MIKFAKSLFKITFQEELEFRNTTFIMFLTMGISLIAIYFLWSDVLSAGNSLKSFNKKELVSYYVFISFVFMNLGRGIPLSEQIRTGYLSSFLCRPISYIYYAYIQFLSRIAFNTIISIPIILLVYLFFHSHLIIVTNPLNYFYLIVAFVLAAHIMFFIEFLVCMIEFWIMYSETVDLIFDTIKSFFMGALIPLAFLPNIFSLISDILPYKYAGSFIVESFMGRITGIEVLIGFFISIGWIFLLFLISLFVWKRGLKRFEAYGA